MSSMAANAYRSVRRSSLVEGCSPHELVSMLYTGALSQISIAQQHTDRNEQQARHRCIDKAMAIVNELQASLRDVEKDPLSGNLFSLYAFVVEQLLQADRHMDDKPLLKAIEILETLHDAWLAIAPETATA